MTSPGSPLDAAGKLPYAQMPVGTAASTVAAGDDSRFGAAAIPTWAALTVYTANQRAVLPTGGIGYSTTARTSRASWDATERDAWTFLPGGHYELLLSGVTGWKCPVGITQDRSRLVGSGGSAGGAGSASGATLQGPAGAGGSAAAAEFEITGYVAGSTYTCSIGAAKAGGAGGAAGGNTGASGTNGDSTTFTGPGGTVYSAPGGGRGLLSGANVTTVGSGGLYGTPNATQPATTFYPGGGGAGGVAPVPLGGQSGGAGGLAATATLGGNGGGARLLTAPGASIPAPSGNTGTSAGGNGVTATQYGCGGGGGGGGAAGTGKGGDGGGSAQGCIEKWF